MAMDNETRKVVPFASGHSRAQWVSIFLALVVVLDVVAVVSDYMQIHLIQRVVRGETITMAEAVANDSRQAIIGGAYLVLFVITGILFCMWIHRVHRNLPPLGASNLKYSPAWAVGGFFVPILNLFRPFQVTTEIWKASDPTGNISDGLAWKSAPTSPLIASWWVLFLISALVGNIVLRMSLQAEMPSELLTVSWLTFVMDFVDIPAAILAIFVVLNIDRRQGEKSRRLTGYAAI